MALYIFVDFIAPCAGEGLRMIDAACVENGQVKDVFRVYCEHCEVPGYRVMDAEVEDRSMGSDVREFDAIVRFVEWCARYEGAVCVMSREPVFAESFMAKYGRSLYHIWGFVNEVVDCSSLLAGREGTRRRTFVPLPAYAVYVCEAIERFDLVSHITPEPVTAGQT